MIKTYLYKPFIRSLMVFLAVAGGGALYGATELVVNQSNCNDDNKLIVTSSYGLSGLFENVSVEQAYKLDISNTSIYGLQTKNLINSGIIHLHDKGRMSVQSVGTNDGQIVLNNAILWIGNINIKDPICTDAKFENKKNMRFQGISQTEQARLAIRGTFTNNSSIAFNQYSRIEIYENGSFINNNTIDLSNCNYFANWGLNKKTRCGKLICENDSVLIMPNEVVLGVPTTTSKFEIEFKEGAIVRYEKYFLDLADDFILLKEKSKYDEYPVPLGITFIGTPNKDLITLTISDVADNEEANKSGNILDLAQDGLNPTITEDTTIDFDLDLSNVNDLSSLDTGSHNLTVNGNLTLPESVSVKSEKFKITTFNGKVYGKRNISVDNNEIKIGDSSVTTGIMVGEKPIEDYIEPLTISDVADNENANEVGNKLLITSNTPILPVIDEEVVIDFDIYVQDGITLTINNKVKGDGTIYIEEGGMVDSKGGALCIPLINSVGGKLVLK